VIEFLPPDSEIPQGYQLATLRMIFDVKSNLRRKARLVVGVHKVDASGYSSYSSVVRLDSTRLLNVIAKAQGLNVLAGDVGNAYLNACTKEKNYCICGPKFGPELEGRIAIIKKGLYGLKSSGAQWHAHFAMTLYTMGFILTRFDPNVWIKRREDGKGYDYISTYVDDFLITAKNPKKYMSQLQEVYTIKNPMEPNDYLGTTYVGNPSSKWCITAKKYIKESISQIEKRMGIIIREERTPMKTDNHPETDATPLLDNVQHREYQSLIGMLQRAVTLCRIDICYATSSMSRFSAAPREGHLSRVLRIWGYLKKYPNCALNIDHKPIPNTDEIQQKAVRDFANQYSYAKEEVDIRFPKPLGDEMKVNIYFDSDHAHDKITGRSISGLVVYVGSTPCEVIAG